MRPPGNLSSLSLPPEAAGGHVIGGPKLERMGIVYHDMVGEAALDACGLATFFRGKLKHSREVSGFLVLAKGKSEEGDPLWIPVVGARVSLRIEGFPVEAGIWVDVLTGGDGRAPVPIRQSTVPIGPAGFIQQIGHPTVVEGSEFRVEVRCPEIAFATVRVAMCGTEMRPLA